MWEREKRDGRRNVRELGWDVSAWRNGCGRKGGQEEGGFRERKKKERRVRMR